MVRALRVGRMFMLVLFPFGPAVIVTVAQSDNAIDRDRHDAGLLTANADPVVPYASWVYAAAPFAISWKPVARRSIWRWRRPPLILRAFRPFWRNKQKRRGDRQCKRDIECREYPFGRCEKHQLMHPARDETFFAGRAA